MIDALQDHIDGPAEVEREPILQRIGQFSVGIVLGWKGGTGMLLDIYIYIYTHVPVMIEAGRR